MSAVREENLLRSEAELRLALVLWHWTPPPRNCRLTVGATGKKTKGREIQAYWRAHLPPRGAVGYKDTRELRLGCRELAYCS